MKTRLLEAAPVLPSQNIECDGVLHKKHVGFSTLYRDKMYALIQHKNINYSSIYDELPSFSSDDDN